MTTLGFDESLLEELSSVARHAIISGLQFQLSIVSRIFITDIYQIYVNAVQVWLSLIHINAISILCDLST